MKKVFAVLLSSILWFVIGVICSVVARAADTVTIQGSMKTHKTVLEPAKAACQKATIDLWGNSAGEGAKSLITGKCDIAM